MHAEEVSAVETEKIHWIFLLVIKSAGKGVICTKRSCWLEKRNNFAALGDVMETRKFRDVVLKIRQT